MESMGSRLDTKGKVEKVESKTVMLHCGSWLPKFYWWVTGWMWVTAVWNYSHLLSRARELWNWSSVALSFHTLQAPSLIAAWLTPRVVAEMRPISETFWSRGAKGHHCGPCQTRQLWDQQNEFGTKNWTGVIMIGRECLKATWILYQGFWRGHII